MDGTHSIWSQIGSRLGSQIGSQIGHTEGQMNPVRMTWLMLDKELPERKCDSWLVLASFVSFLLMKTRPICKESEGGGRNTAGYFRGFFGHLFYWTSILRTFQFELHVKILYRH